MDHLSFLGKMTSEMSALEKEFEIVIKLYTISKDFEVDIDPEELALYQILAPSFQHLKVRKDSLYSRAASEPENAPRFLVLEESTLTQLIA